MKTDSLEYVKEQLHIHARLTYVRQSKKPFGETLKALMQEREVSYARLADMARTVDPAGKGLSQGYIHNLATKTRQPTPQNIELLAKSLRVDPTHFREYRDYVISTEAKLLAEKYGFTEIMERLRTVGKEDEGSPTKNKNNSAPPKINSASPAAACNFSGS